MTLPTKCCASAFRRADHLRWASRLAGFGIGAGSVFQALGYSVYSMVVSLIRQLVVLIPCAYVIGRVTGDVTGVWWAFFIAELVSLMVSALYLRRVNRNVIRTI